MDFGFTSVAAITVICYLIIEIIKTTPLDRKWLPIISGLLGGALGVVAMLIMPSYPASDYLNAIAIGIVSGLAATGINQVAKQLKTKR
ncbi:MAG: enolase [Clostridiales bacterium]|jgi:O-antigen/teichoic acid export membrane protein|nr:enolase [Clostridiales bacterium]